MDPVGEHVRVSALRGHRSQDAARLGQGRSRHVTTQASILVPIPTVSQRKAGARPRRLVSAGVTIAAGMLLPFGYLLPEILEIQGWGYFNVDDFDNIYWTYRLNPAQMLDYIL